MSKYYPVNLALENKKCVVIGAGSVARRKVRRLLECGARVTVISPEITPGLKAAGDGKGQVVFKQKRFSLRDLNGAYLVIAATADRKINSAVSSYCLNRGILVNCVDSPMECSFIAPSVVRKGDLTISISTGGLSPALSKKIRQDIERMFLKPAYAVYLRMMKKVRPRALKEIKNPRSRKAFFKKTLETYVP